MEGEGDGLTPARKGIYALGDLTVNAVLGSLSLVYATYFLIHVAGLRPALAGLVPLVGRVLDAAADPLMGRLSDATRWKAGRRRPYFLLGALPFGASFALLWVDPPLASQGARFAYYTVVYLLVSLSMTVLSVPYLALIPEMALGYHERTSLNTYRSAGALLGLVAALSVRPLANALGGGHAGYASAGLVLGVAFALPWIGVYRVSFERPDFQARGQHTGLVEALRSVARHRTFLQLTGLFLFGRIAMDLIGATLILYFTHALGRGEDFERVMLVFLVTVVAALPFWLRVARHTDKSTVFVIGSLWWMAAQLVLLFAQPDWPRWLFFCFAPVLAVGFAVVDLMPWAMVGDVVDEDELHSGERREGLYNGAFTLLRKVGAALAVSLALGLLDLLGLEPGREPTPGVVLAVKVLTALGPVLFLGVGIAFARGYPLTRERHERILAELGRRGARPGPGSAPGG